MFPTFSYSSVESEYFAFFSGQGCDTENFDCQTLIAGYTLTNPWHTIAMQILEIPTQENARKVYYDNLGHGIRMQECENQIDSVCDSIKRGLAQGRPNSKYTLELIENYTHLQVSTRLPRPERRQQMQDDLNWIITKMNPTAMKRVQLENYPECQDDPFVQLPQEIMLQILQESSPQAYGRMCQVSKYLHQFGQDASLKEKFYLDFFRDAGIEKFGQLKKRLALKGISLAAFVRSHRLLLERFPHFFGIRN
jgi:hypothetical protein